MRLLCRLALLFSGFALVAHGEVQVMAGPATKDGIRSELLVLPGGWAAQIPPHGRVNPPDFLAALHPRQQFALGLFAEGAHRDALLQNVTLSVRINCGRAAPMEVHDLKPVTIRPIKAEGADMALIALTAAGIGAKDRAKMEDGMSLVTLAVFPVDWVVPDAADETEVEITANVSGATVSTAIAPVHLKIHTAAHWLKAPPLAANQLAMNRYRGDLAPGELLARLEAMAVNGHFRAPPVAAFFTLAFKSDAAARAAAVDAYPLLTPQAQAALLAALRLGGGDLQQLYPALPAEIVERYAAVAPLADPRLMPHFQDPVDPTAVAAIGNTMDQCWGGWMATGDASYLRALVDLLNGAPDFPAFQSWQATRGGAKGLNAEVARGLAYQIAGWSISSFQRTDPAVADWLLYWQHDPAVPATIRREIAALPTNPAFRRK